MSPDLRPSSAPSGDLRRLNSQIAEDPQSQITPAPLVRLSPGESKYASQGSPTSSTSQSDQKRKINTHVGAINNNLPVESPQLNPWKRKTLLTLDGGGVRGYSSLLILQALITKIAALEQDELRACSSVFPLKSRPCENVRIAQNRRSTLRGTEGSELPICGPPPASSIYLPAHYFDYIAGTSTGGLIAIMLGRLSMTVDECLEAYESLADGVFGRPRHFHIRRPPWIPRDKYDHKLLEDIFKEIIRKRRSWSSDDMGSYQSNPDMCRTIVVAWQKLRVKGTRVPYLFRSYRHPATSKENPLERNPDRVDNYPIWQVARATSAAPTYFKAVKLEEDDEKYEFIDGGFGANNPSAEAYRSVKQLSKDEPTAVSAFISVGTGKNLEAEKNPSAGYRLYLRYANAAIKWASQSESVHEDLIEKTNGRAEYCRLNVEHGLGKMKLDTWKGKKGSETLDWIRARTEEYLNSEAAKDQIHKSAKHLVRIRRERAFQQNSDHWERFCHGVEYACCKRGCTNGERYKEEEELVRHLKRDHNMKRGDKELQPLIQNGKRYPLFETPT